MSRGIIGVTVGTPISPKAIERKLKPVKTVNGVKPDENGNVNIEGGTGEDGFSPVAKVTQTDTGAVISITDKEGTTTATVANGKDGAQGIQGVRGRGILIITSKPTVNTEVANGTTPPYKVSMTLVIKQAGVTKDDILVGDIIESNGEHYKVLALGNGRIYLDNPVTIKGADGKSAYAYAQEAGYTGTETEFANKLASDSSGGVTSWNDLTDKPFYAINPTFNGDLTGREVFPLNDYVNLVKITDIILKEEDCVGKTVTAMSTDGIVTLPVTNKGIIDTTSMYGVPSFGVSADEIVDSGVFFVCVIKEPSTVEGIFISAGTYYLYYSAIGLYTSYFSAFDDMKLVKTLDSKYLPDYLPSIEVVDSTFDGDLTGRETVFVQEGTYAVKVSPEYVTVAQLIGATLAVDMQGTEQTMTLTAETAMDSTSILGVSGAVVLQGIEPIVLSLAEDSTIQGATFTAGTWFMCVPGSFYVKSLSCLFSGETIRKMDERCLPDNVATKEYVEEVILGGAW